MDIAAPSTLAGRDSVTILVDRAEFEDSATSPWDEPCTFDCSTSVSRVKRDFLDALASAGTVVRFDRSSSQSMRDTLHAIASPRTICASFHEPPPDCACRLLQHTKGGLMLPGGFLGGWAFRESTMNLVETARQQDQLTSAFGPATPRLAVFAQKLATEVFSVRPKAARLAARASLGVGVDTTHLLYAGRWIANKGLAQIARALHLWPMDNARLSLVGAFDDDFPISQCDGTHLMFRDFFRREIVARSPRLTVCCIPAMSQDRLSEWHAASDVFVCPSFHEDEASGNSAHEAVLSGLPAVVTDWSGLGQLGRNTRGGAVPTFASLGGVRFSLADLRVAIELARPRQDLDDDPRAFSDAEWVRRTFDPSRMRASLAEAVSQLADLPASEPPRGGWRCRERARRMASIGPPGFRRAASRAGSEPPPGLYVDGVGCGGDPSFSLPHLMHGIQAMYTTWPVPPEIRIGDTLRGFWRVSLWPQERALVEFGFPGPRLLRFPPEDWDLVMRSCPTPSVDDAEFRPESPEQARLLQRAVDFGYLVPDHASAPQFNRSVADLEG